MMKEFLLKYFPMLMNNRGEVNLEEGDSATEEEQSMEDLIAENLANEGGPDENEEAEEPEDKEDNEDNKGEDENKDETIENKDDEYVDEELSFGEDEEGNEIKYKKSDVVETLKWLKQNGQSIAGAMKVRELASKNPDFGKLLNSVIENSIGENETINSEYVTASLEKLEKKAEKIEEIIEDKDDDIEEAEAVLDELDPDSSQARALRKSIKIMRSQKDQLSKALSKIDDVTAKLEGIDKKNEESTKNEQQENLRKEIEEARKTFNSEYEVLTKEVAFINDGEKKQFLQNVKSMVAAQSDKIKNDTDYKKVIGESVKAVKQELDKYHEAIRMDYLRKKGEKPKDENKTKTKPIQPEEVNQESVAQQIEDMLINGVPDDE